MLRPPCMEFACSPRAYVGFLRVFRLHQSTSSVNGELFGSWVAGQGQGYTLHWSSNIGQLQTTVHSHPSSHFIEANVQVFRMWEKHRPPEKKVNCVRPEFGFKPKTAKPRNCFGVNQSCSVPPKSILKYQSMSPLKARVTNSLRWGSITWCKCS